MRKALEILLALKESNARAEREGVGERARSRFWISVN